MFVELEYDDEIMHGTDAEAVDWFYKDILGSKQKNDLILHSNEIGDEIGTIKVLDIPSSEAGEGLIKKV